MNRKLFCAALLMLLLFLYRTVAFAADTRPTFASCPSSGDEKVLVQSNQAGSFLCLPGAWDIHAVMLVREGASCLYLGKEKFPVPADTPVDLSSFLGSRIAVFNEKGQQTGSLLILQGSSIPAFFFDVDARQLNAVNHSKDNVITEGRLTVLEPDNTRSYAGSLACLKGRGNNTFRYPKTPYEFKLTKSAALWGIDAGKTWILLANYLDLSFLRNQLVLDLCREIGLRFSVECSPADVWANGEYLGLYLLTEKIQIKKNRVNITNLEKATEAVNTGPLDSFRKITLKDDFVPWLTYYDIPNDPEDITGGYIAVLEKRYRLRDFRKPGVRTKKNLSVRIKEPTNPSRAQVFYFGSLMQRLHSAVIASDGIDPATQTHYSAIIDVPSFALKFLIEDFSKDYDAIAGSQYLFKDSDRVDPLIYAGPAWDYDLSFGNMSKGKLPRGDFADKPRNNVVNLWAQLAKHPDFMAEVSTRWQSTVRPALAVLLGEKEAAPGGILRSFTEYKEAIVLSAAMDAARRGTGNRPVESSAGKDFQSAASFLEKWIRERVAWMDSRYGASP